MASTERNIGWVVQEISEEMKTDFIKQVNEIMDKTDKEKDIAEHIKQFFDSKYAPNWHCVVGKHFASFVTYQSKNYIFCQIGQHAIILYKL
jgi:dynein light chain LC8-type